MSGATRTFGSSCNNISFFRIGEVSFRDALQFFQESVESLSESASPEEKQEIRKHNEVIIRQHEYLSFVYNYLTADERKELLDLLEKKGTIPYDYFKTGFELLKKIYLSLQHSILH